MKLRLFSQILISILVWTKGVQINSIDLSLLLPNYQFINLSNTLSLLITVFWIVAITNSFNWIDGLDGLLSGVTILTTFSLSLLILYVGSNDILFLIAALIGASWGFYILIFIQLRFLWEMADLILLGSLIAFFCIYSHNYFLNNNIPQFSFLWQFLIVIIPITDINYVFFSRIFEGISPFYPDRRHFHFKIQKSRIYS